MDNKLLVQRAMNVLETNILQGHYLAKMDSTEIQQDYQLVTIVRMDISVQVKGTFNINYVLEAGFAMQLI